MKRILIPSGAFCAAFALLLSVMPSSAQGYEGVISKDGVENNDYSNQQNASIEEWKEEYHSNNPGVAVQDGVVYQKDAEVMKDIVDYADSEEIVDDNGGNSTVALPEELNKGGDYKHKSGPLYPLAQQRAKVIKANVNKERAAEGLSPL
jgi:hypothetical protein